VEKYIYNFFWHTSGDLPAALTVATATAISAADNGSKGWHLWALVIIGIPAYFWSSKTLVQSRQDLVRISNSVYRVSIKVIGCE